MGLKAAVEQDEPQVSRALVERGSPGRDFLGDSSATKPWNPGLKLPKNPLRTGLDAVFRNPAVSRFNSPVSRL